MLNYLYELVSFVARITSIFKDSSLVKTRCVSIFHVFISPNSKTTLAMEEIWQENIIARYPAAERTFARAGRMGRLIATTLRKGNSPGYMYQTKNSD